MSLATKTAIAAAMLSDAALVALLPKRPRDPSTPAIFNSNKTLAPPVYPCVTYRISSGVPDKRFRPPIQTGGPSSVEDEYLDIEAWSQKPECAEIEAIAESLNALFDGQALALTTGRIFRAELLMSQSDLYDDKLNAWYGLYRFRLRIKKG
ncbi:MAG: hypothetical protein JWQ02_1529 [Capsulimonas sp.]|nr:hypothetical protein [Capsulimonas sp.]